MFYSTYPCPTKLGTTTETNQQTKLEPKLETKVKTKIRTNQPAHENPVRHPQGSKRKQEHSDTILMAQQKQQRFELHTRNWMPNFNVILKEAVATQQGIGIQNHQPRKQVQNLSETQSKYEWCNSDNGDMFVGLMRPRGDALRHPAAKDLLEYATKGFPGPKLGYDPCRPCSKRFLMCRIAILLYF